MASSTNSIIVEFDTFTFNNSNYPPGYNTDSNGNTFFNEYPAPHIAVHRNGDAGVALVNMGSTPILATSVVSALSQGASVADAAEQAVAEAEPQADLNASVEYRTHLAKVLTRRALEACGS